MRKPRSTIGFRGVLVVIVGGLAAAWGCGSGSSTSGLCEQGCDKAATCGGADAAACKSQCALANAIIASCKNQDELIGRARSCLAMDCAGFAVCMDDQPVCQLGGTGGSGGPGGSGGTAGSGGTSAGGSSGNGGTSGGTASCDVCGKADSCCAKLVVMIGQSPSLCKYTTTCQSKTGADRDSYVMTCSNAVTSAGEAGISGCE